MEKVVEVVCTSNINYYYGTSKDLLQGTAYSFLFPLYMATYENSGGLGDGDNTNSPQTRHTQGEVRST
jgi:hypothetical protein